MPAAPVIVAALAPSPAAASARRCVEEPAGTAESLAPAEPYSRLRRPAPTDNRIPAGQVVLRAVAILDDVPERESAPRDMAIAAATVTDRSAAEETAKVTRAGTRRRVRRRPGPPAAPGRDGRMRVVHRDLTPAEGRWRCFCGDS
jgi:hypothetical protein